MAEPQKKTEPVIVKKYANRRLYNTDTSTYVTLEDLAEMVRNERDFIVYDAKSGEDLTHSVLTQIIVEQESRGQNLLPINFLRQLIRFYGDSLERLVPSYLEMSINKLTREQERYRQQFASAFGASAIEAMQEQARQNFALFEKTLFMFTPFANTESRKLEAPSEPPVALIAHEPKAPAAPRPALADQRSSSQQAAGQSSPPNLVALKPAQAQAAQPLSTADEIAMLKAQLEAMQQKLEQLSKG